MSARLVARALARLASPDAVLARERDGAGFGVFPQGDRRRRTLARISADEVRVLESEGAIARESEDCFVLTGAGAARVRRRASNPEEAYAAQHRPIVARQIVDRDGGLRVARGHEANACLRRLAGLTDAGGAAWLSGAELAAAAQLRSDWEAGEAGLVRGSDWTAPPNSSAARGAGNAIERLAGARCDARRRVEEGLASLAPPLRRVVEAVCLQERGLEALERSEGWPARSGKLALKLGLAQLALRQDRPCAARASD